MNKKVLVVSLLIAVFIGAVVLFQTNTFQAVPVDLSLNSVKHLLAQTNSVAQQYADKNHGGAVSAQSVRASSDEIVITYDNSNPSNYFICDLVIDVKSAKVTQIIKGIGDAKQNSANIREIEYDLDYFLAVTGMTTCSFSVDWKHISIFNSSTYYVCNYATGEYVMR